LTPDDADMTDDDSREEIERLEVQVDELPAKIDSCRKLILAGRIAMAAGGVALIAMLTGVIGLNPSVMSAAVAALFGGGIVAAGSSGSTAKEDLAEAEAKRATLIEQLNLRLVPDHDDLLENPQSHCTGRFLRTHGLQLSPESHAIRISRCD
jgi:hypothetical protein